MFILLLGSHGFGDLARPKSALAARPLSSSVSLRLAPVPATLWVAAANLPGWRQLRFPAASGTLAGTAASRRLALLDSAAPLGASRLLLPRLEERLQFSRRFAAEAGHGGNLLDAGQAHALH